MSQDRKLSPKQSLFVREYLVDLNASEAALRAGYADGSIGRRLVTKAHVLALIQAGMDKRGARVGMTADQVLVEIKNLASADPAEAFNADGTLKSIHDMPAELRRSISGIDVEEAKYDRDGVEIRGIVRKIRFWSKPHALELAGKNLALFVERRRLEDRDGNPITEQTDLVRMATLIAQAERSVVAVPSNGSSGSNGTHRAEA